MKSIDEIVNVCNPQTHEYYPINFTNLNLYMRLTNINDINKESLENFFGDNLYKRNETQEYLTHVLSRHAFREGLTIEKTTKLYEIIYELINPNLPAWPYGTSSIVEFFFCSLPPLYFKTNIEFTISFLKFLFRINVKNNFDVNYTDGQNIHFLNYANLVNNYLYNISHSLEFKTDYSFDYVDYIKSNLNTQEIILNKEDVIINGHALDKSIYKRYKEMATCLNQLTKDSLQIDSDSLEKLGLIYGDKLFEFLQNDFQQLKSDSIKRETEAHSLKLKLIKKQIENIKENTP